MVMTSPTGKRVLLLQACRVKRILLRTKLLRYAKRPLEYRVDFKFPALPETPVTIALALLLPACEFTGISDVAAISSYM